MGSPWEGIQISAPEPSTQPTGTAAPNPASPWNGIQITGPKERGTTDTSQDFNPYSFLKSLPRQKGDAKNIDDLNPEFAHRFAMFSKDAQGMFPKYQITDAARLDQRGHTAGSMHYSGQAADILPAWEYKKTPESLASLTSLAQKHGLNLLDEWDDSDNSHFHISLSKSMPKGDRTKPTGQVSGRQRSTKQMEGFARDYAASIGVDPDIVTNILRVDTNYAKDQVGHDGTYGMAKLTEAQAAPFLEKHGRTWKDYLNNESLQMMVAADRYAALVKPELGGSGDNAKAVAAYHAGTEGLNRFQQVGRVDYTSTKDFVSRVLGIPVKQVDQAVVKGGVAPYDPAVVSQKKANQLGTNPYVSSSDPTQQIVDNMGLNPNKGTAITPSTSERQQMYRNAGDMFSNPFSGNDLGVQQPKLDVPAPIAASYLPQMSIRDGLTMNGTVDDKHWAVQNMKHSINNSLLHIPGVILPSMRVDEDYNQWQNNMSKTWGGWAALQGNDFIGSLPLMGYAAQTMIPKLLGKAGAAIGMLGGDAALQAASRSSATALTWMAENIPYARTLGAIGSMPANIPGNLKNSVFGYLMEKGMFGQVAGWSSVMGFNGMNQELQRQFQAGKTLDEAWPRAYQAGMHDAAMGGLVTMAFPIVGGTALAMLKSALGVGPKAAAELVAEMRAGKLFGEQGPGVAKVIDGAWGLLPESLQNFMGDTATKIAGGVKAGEKGWFMNMVKDSASQLAALDHVAKNESAQVGMVRNIKEVMDEGQARIESINTGIKTAQETQQQAQARVDKLNQYMRDLSSKDPNNAVNSFKNYEQQLQELKAQQAAGKDAAGKPLVDAKGKQTPAGKDVADDLILVRKRLSEAVDPATPGSKWVRALLNARRLMNGDKSDPLNPVVGALEKLAEAKNNFLLTSPEIPTILERLGFLQKNLEAMHKEGTDALTQGRVPDHANAISLVPTPANATAAEVQEFRLLQARLGDRAKLSVRMGNDEAYKPLLQQELQMQVDASLLATTPARAEMVNQISTIDNATKAMAELKSRSRNPRTSSALDYAIEQMKKFKDSLGGKVELDPKTGKVIKQGVGAIHFTPTNIKEVLTGKNIADTGAQYPKGLPLKGAADLIERLMAITTPEFPNGLPIAMFAEKGMKYAAQDPLSLRMTAEALSQAGTMLMSENAAPSISMVRGVLDRIASGTLAAEGDHATYSLMDRFSTYGIGTRQAADVVMKARAMKLETANEVFGAAQYFGNFMMSFEKAGLRLADDVLKHFNERIMTATGLKAGQRLPREFENEFAVAIDGGRDKVIEFLQKTHTIDGKQTPGSKFVEPMQMYFDVMAGLERFKQQSPESASAFRYNYFMRTYPRLLKFMQRGSEDAKRLSISAPWEKARSIESLEQAFSNGEKAWNEVVALSTAAGKPFKNWEEYAYGTKGVADRAARLGLRDESKAAQLLKDILLGDAITAPGEVLHNVIHSTMRVDATRHFLTQLQTMEMDGLPLIIHEANKKYSTLLEKLSTQKVPYREHGTWGGMKDDFYTEVNQMPGISSYFGPDGQKSLIHPQARNLFEKYLLSAPEEGAGVVKAGWTGMRTLALIGSPFNYLASLMSNYTTLVGFNFAKAFGLIPLGEQVAEETPILMMRAIGAGLQPASLLRNSVGLPTDLMSTAKDNPLISEAFKKVWGLDTPLSKALEGNGGKIPKFLLAPVRMMEGMDGFLNKIGLFKVLTDAQLGAWTYYTGQVMKTHGAKLLEETGGKYGAALMLAERHAAAHVNKLAGVVPYHMMSSKMRDTIYGIALAPQYASAKWDTLVDAFDGVISAFGGRSRHAWKASETLVKQRKQDLGNFLVGGMISGFVYSNMLNYYMTGHSTFENPEGHELDINLGDNTYISNPLYGMFRSVFKGMGTLAMTGEPEKAFNAFMGQLHPIFQTALAFGRGKDPMTGEVIRPRSMGSLEWWKAMGQQLLQRSVNIGDMGYRPGTSPDGMGIKPTLLPIPGVPRTDIGVPMTGKEWLLQVAGASPTRGVPAEMQLSNSVKKDLEYAKSQMSQQLQVRLQLALRYPEGSDDQKRILQDAVRFATMEGVPTGSARAAAVLKNYNPNGNYVLMDNESLMSEIDAAMNPHGEAYKRVDKAFRPMLHDMIEKQLHEQALGYLAAHRMDHTPQDVEQERTRRLGGYEEMYPTYIPIPIRRTHRTHYTPPYKGHSPVIGTPDVMLPTANPIDNDKILKMKRR